MKKSLIMGAVALLALAGCEDETPEQKQARAENNGTKSRVIAVVDGCRIWEVYNDQGHNPFFARCPEGSETTFEQWSTGGKTPTTKRVQTLGD